ncbi:E3 ubiquitin-protein ligase PUB23-like [Senna tora]|uniref:E3 ubiquitin-protein ligase PUB23-like n=1 Tax=Senna tora TaxID=362788 RepID=A0A834SR59_9FABA|nr:E3 ubiquitin-protein ligase PUB23-like [Senna tora]
MSPIGCYGNVGKRVEKAEKEAMEFEEVGFIFSKFDLQRSATQPKLKSESESQIWTVIKFLQFDIMDGFDLKTKPTDEALSLLHTHHISEPSLNTLLTFKHGDFAPCLTRIMQIGFYESCAYVVLLLKSVLGAADSTVLSNLQTEILVEVVQILKDRISP